jgi:hypothetical protein
MNENETTPAATTTAPEAKPAKAKKAAPKKTKKTAAQASRVKLLKPTRQVLAVLSKGACLTRQTIAARVQSQLKDKLINNRISNESNTYRDLCSSKWIKVREMDVDGKTETCYEITASGKKALADAKTK